MTASDDQHDYHKSKIYWENQPSTLNGVLGGFEYLNHADLASSRDFLLKQLEGKHGSRALDCGCGIGRITEQLLSSLFACIDLVEQNQAYLDVAKRLNKVGDTYCIGLQDLPSLDIPHKYDLIWIQWVTIYLNDEDFVRFLQKCSTLLSNNGLIVVKENLSSSPVENVWLTEDCSVMRSDSAFIKIFEDSKLTIVDQQVDLKVKRLAPKIYPVKMFALRNVVEQA